MPPRCPCSLLAVGTTEICHLENIRLFSFTGIWQYLVGWNIPLPEKTRLLIAMSYTRRTNPVLNHLGWHLHRYVDDFSHGESIHCVFDRRRSTNGKPNQPMATRKKRQNAKDTHFEYSLGFEAKTSWRPHWRPHRHAVFHKKMNIPILKPRWSKRLAATLATTSGGRFRLFSKEKRGGRQIVSARFFILTGTETNWRPHF